MSDNNNNDTSVVKIVTDSLSNIFRHIIPGIIIITLAHFCMPELFLGLEFKETGNFVILGAVAIAIGNFWYAFHRYTFHQLCDFIFYVLVIRKRFKKEYPKKSDYYNWISRHSIESFDIRKTDRELIGMVHIRSAHHILLFISCEALIFFSYFMSNTSKLIQYKWYLFGVGIVGFLLSCSLWYSVPWYMEQNVFRDVMEDKDSKSKKHK
ncbi:MAG: hypothetical protein J0M18_13670 [Ignavibacteria bacterium]|nr:hypothetical protein [Ignavibacteria bacterium]